MVSVVISNRSVPDNSGTSTDASAQIDALISKQKALRGGQADPLAQVDALIAGQKQGTPAPAPAPAPERSRFDYLGRYLDTQKEMGEEGLRTAKAGIDDMFGPDKSVGDRVVGGLSAALGGLGYVTSPVNAAYREVIGRPVRGVAQMAGASSETARLAGDIAETTAQLLTPGIGLVGAAGKAGLAAAVARETAAPVERGLLEVQKVLAPSTVSAEGEAAGNLLREATGIARRQKAQDAARFDTASRARMNTLTRDDELDFFRYVEGRSKGAALANPELQQEADTARSIFSLWKERLESLPRTSTMAFVEDYFPHLWKDPEKARSFLGSRTGGAGHTKARTYPTIEEGLRAGLELRDLSIVDSITDYSAKMAAFVTHNQAFDKAKDLGHVRFFSSPVKAPQGWAPLEGPLATNAVGAKAYAPEDFARVYNNFVDPGFTGAFGGMVDKARAASNAITAWELGLSMFHATTMAQESFAAGFARATQSALGGKPATALKELISAPLEPVMSPRRGAKLTQAYLKGLGPDSPNGALYNQIADLLTKAGGRAKGMEREYHILDGRRGPQSFVTAFNEKALARQFAEEARAIGENPARIVPALARNSARVLETFSKPLFEHYIPAMKNGAFFSSMKNWLARNPTASETEQVAAARRIWDSVDNRFGEVVQDNLFVRRHVKQLAQIGMRSYSWNLGTVREIGGGAVDLARDAGRMGKELRTTGKTEVSERAAYLPALAISYGLWNAAAQYLFTGEAPKDLRDFFHFRTGEIDPASGQPVRGRIPSYMNDVFGWYEDPLQEARNKLATGPRLAGETVTGRDWRGLPISRPEASVADKISDYATHYSKNLGPLSLRTMFEDKKKGTDLGPVPEFFGLRATGKRDIDPRGFEQMMTSIRYQDWQKKLQADENDARSRGQTVKAERLRQERIEYGQELNALRKEWQKAQTPQEQEAVRERLLRWRQDRKAMRREAEE